MKNKRHARFIAAHRARFIAARRTRRGLLVYSVLILFIINYLSPSFTASSTPSAAAAAAAGSNNAATATVASINAGAFKVQRLRPNIVLILADDLGWADLSAYGSSFYRTPNIDRLAARGIKFTDAYAASPVCSPSRAALLTGKHPARLHLTDWLPGRENMPNQKLLHPAIKQQLPLGDVTIAEALKRFGYKTASIGKWHLGGKGFSPENQGFDLNIAGDDSGVPASYFFPFRNKERSMPRLEQGQAGEYLTDRLTTEAEKFIEQNKAAPFFLYLSHYAVHIPMKAKPEIIRKYQDSLSAAAATTAPAAAARTTQNNSVQNNAVYAAMIESLDDSVGRIMRKLEELNLIDNTLVIFTSDNGGLTVKEGANTPATSNAPLRDGKGFLYEGGIRVPLIVYRRGMIKPKSISRLPVSQIDLAATMLEVAGVNIPRPMKADGNSLVPLLKGTSFARREALFWHYPHYSNQGGKPSGAIRAGDYKLIEFFEDNHVELYNLRDDAGERYNLAAKMPEKVAPLRSKLHRWRKSVAAQMMRSNPAYTKANANQTRAQLNAQPIKRALLNARRAN